MPKVKFILHFETFYWNMTDYMLSERLMSIFKNSAVCVIFPRKSLLNDATHKYKKALSSVSIL